MKQHLVLQWFIVSLIAINLQACDSVQQLIQGTPTSTSTPIPTATTRPSITPSPTSTPNLAATQQYESVFALVQGYFKDGNVPSMNTAPIYLQDYSDSLAEDGSYQWATVGLNVKNFILSTHITMTTANSLSIRTGCGIAFRDHDRFHDIVYVQQNGKASYIFSTFKESAQYFGEVSNPAELDYVLIVKGKSVVLFIDGKQALTFDRSVEVAGDVGFTIVSGSNEDFGSRCEFKDTVLWTIN